MSSSAYWIILWKYLGSHFLNGLWVLKKFKRTLFSDGVISIRWLYFYTIALSRLWVGFYICYTPCLAESPVLTRQQRQQISSWPICVPPMATYLGNRINFQIGKIILQHRKWLAECHQVGPLNKLSISVVTSKTSSNTENSGSEGEHGRLGVKLKLIRIVFSSLTSCTTWVIGREPGKDC